eukprot:TRINITY_DN5574_c0_g4_i1.p1 TRINITY_DN5574_c0_g4~~TRINITY_DN5574_c0_g4_i1.p1  ORF type:complete len:267 (-),score=92.83 TRINITY_DN5574_c0_g4_i1:78-878(-)
MKAFVAIVLLAFAVSTFAHFPQSAKWGTKRRSTNVTNLVGEINDFLNGAADALNLTNRADLRACAINDGQAVVIAERIVQVIKTQGVQGIQDLLHLFSAFSDKLADAVEACGQDATSVRRLIRDVRAIFTLPARPAKEYIVHALFKSQDIYLDGVNAISGVQNKDFYLVGRSVAQFAADLVLLDKAVRANKQPINLAEYPELDLEMSEQAIECGTALLGAFEPIRSFVTSFFSNPKNIPAWLPALIIAGPAVLGCVSACGSMLAKK